MADNADDALATGGLHPDHKYAMELARHLATESGRRLRVRPVNSRLWEIVWADMAFAAAADAEGDRS